MEKACMDTFGTCGVMNQVNFQGKTDPLILYESLVPSGVEKKEIDARLGVFKERYFANLERYIREVETVLLPGVTALLEQLEGRDGLLVGLLTGNFMEGARIKLSVFGLMKYFPFGVFGDDTHIRNEMPGIARKKIKDLYDADVDFGRMAVIGDTIYDIECGKKSGAVTIAVGTGWTDETELLAKKPDYFFRDLSNSKEVIEALREALDF